MENKNPVYADFISFEAETGLIMPEDLKSFFLINNGTRDKYNESLYCFYSFKQFKSIDKELANWKGVPDYSNIVNTLEDYQDCFVFADHMFHLFAYAMRLNKESAVRNEVYAICGDQYKVVAGTFTEFMKLYSIRPDELQF